MKTYIVQGKKNRRRAEGRKSRHLDSSMSTMTGSLEPPPFEAPARRHFRARSATAPSTAAAPKVAPRIVGKADAAAGPATSAAGEAGFPGRGEGCGKGCNEGCNEGWGEGWGEGFRVETANSTPFIRRKAST